MVDTPHSDHFDDIYFAAEGGLEESRYVFLEQNHLPQSWQNKSQFVICETGFGTGLNFLCAWTEFEKTTQPHQHLHYYSFEKYPLSPTEIQKYLAHWSTEFDGRLEKLIADYPLRVGGWHTINISSRVTITLIFDDVNRAIPELDTPIDCWFLDGHAPAKNPDMWSDLVFQNIGRLSREGTRCATFTAAGIVKRGLGEAGFTVSKARGFGRKRDMIIGHVESSEPHSQNRIQAVPEKIAIIGGGIAGAALVHALSPYLPDITLFEKTAIASGGSGNLRGLYNPRITALRGPEADFYSPAFSLAYKKFLQLSQSEAIDFVPNGCLHLMTDDQKENRFRSFIENWSWHHHASIVNAGQASHIAGTALTQSALYLPDSGMVSPRKLTEILARPAKLIIKDIASITRSGTGWIVDHTYFDCVILAGGSDVLKFAETQFLPLQKIRGQVTYIKSTPAYASLKTNICYGGYASTVKDGQAIIGSTFQHWIDTDTIRPEDDIENINKLKAVAPDLGHDLDMTGSRAAFRCAAKDRRPVIGKVDGCENLYISTGHGSHGIISSMMGAAYLSAQIQKTLQIAPRSVDQFLSPARFRK